MFAKGVVKDLRAKRQTNIETLKKLHEGSCKGGKETARKWECRYCNSTFKSERTAISHEEKCQGRHSGKCRYCNKVYKDEMARRQHWESSSLQGNHPEYFYADTEDEREDPTEEEERRKKKRIEKERYFEEWEKKHKDDEDDNDQGSGGQGGKGEGEKKTSKRSGGGSSGSKGEDEEHPDWTMNQWKGYYGWSAGGN